MQRPFLSQNKSRLKTKFLPVAVFLFSLVASFFTWKYSYDFTNLKAERNFEEGSRYIVDEISDTINQYIDILYSLQGLYAASKSVEPSEWADFIGKQNIENRYPGLIALRYIEIVKATDSQVFIDKIRSDKSFFAEGYQDFNIYPLTAQINPENLLYVVKYVEPHLKNKSMLGYNLASNFTRLKVLEKCRDSNSPVISPPGKIITGQNGLILTLPIYQNGNSIKSLQERKESILGFVEGILDTQEFMVKMLEKENISKGLFFQVVDEGLSPNDHLGELPFYSTHDDIHSDSFRKKNKLFISNRVRVADRFWRVDSYASTSFGLDRLQRIFPSLVLVAGITFSFLLFWIIYSLANTREKAVNYATRLTKDLSDSQERLSALVLGAPDPIVVLDMLGNVVEMNPEAEKISGYNKKEFVGKHFSKLGILTPGSLAKALGEYALIILGQKRPPYELEMIRKNKELISVEAHSQLFKSGAKGSGIQIIFRDVTSRKKAEAALRDSEATLRGFFQSGAMMMGIIELKDKDILHISDNQKTADFFGTSTEFMRGKLASALGAPREHTLEWIKHYQKSKETKLPVHFEYLHRFSSKGPQWLSVTVCAIESGEGELGDRFAYVAEDITDRMWKEQLIRSNEERFRSLIMNIPGVVYRCKLDKNWTMEFISDSIQEMTGYPASDFIDNKVRSYTSVTHSEDQALMDKIVQESVGQKKSYILEYRVIHRNGSIRYVYEKGQAVFESNGDVRCLDGVIFDITDRKNLEAQLVQAQKMETIGTLAGGVAHDLNNQLTPLTGYLDLALNEIPPDSTSYNTLLLSSESAKRCAEVVQKLVGFSRPSTQDKSYLNIKSIFQDFKNLTSTFIPATIQIKFSVDDSPWSILANETELQTVLMNLVVNARDAVPEVGEILVSAQNVRLDKNKVDASSSGEPYLKLSVQDNGKGIPTNILQKIFEPFFTTKEKGKGTGLGLAMVYKIIKDHNGWIDVESQLNKGSKFTIYLPANPQVIVQKSSRMQKSGPLNFNISGKVLFVDDEELLRNFGKIVLEKLGLEYMIAKDGQEALDLYKKHVKDIAIVVLDMTMPKLTGRETLKGLLQINPKARIILASGYTLEGTPEDLKKQGAMEFIPKPYTVHILGRAIQKVLERRV